MGVPQECEHQGTGQRCPAQGQQCPLQLAALRDLQWEFSRESSPVPEKGSGKGLEHEGAARATSPGPGSPPGLQNTDSPCHIGRVSVTSPAGYGYTG